MGEVETSSGVWENRIIEKKYYGDIIRNIRKNQTVDSVNDNIAMSNEISILADMFAYEHVHMIKYITYMNVKWKVISVDIQYPRMILTYGGVYNG